MSNNDWIGIHRITSAQKVHVRNDDKASMQMCKALGDEISLAIIKPTIEKSTPAIAIAITKAHHVPLSSVYKKIRRLRELGVINIDKINVDDRSGKRIIAIGAESKRSSSVWLLAKRR